MTRSAAKALLPHVGRIIASTAMYSLSISDFASSSKYKRPPALSLLKNRQPLLERDTRITRRPLCLMNGLSRCAAAADIAHPVALELSFQEAHHLHTCGVPARAVEYVEGLGE